MNYRTAKILLALTVIALALGCTRPASMLADIGKYVVTPTGETVKVGTATRDPSTGKIVAREGDTAGIEDSAPTVVKAKPDAAQGIYQTGAFVGTMSRLFLLLSLLTFAASFVPAVSALIPKGAALTGLSIAGGLIVVQYWIVKYGVFVAEVSFWLTLVTAVGAGAAFLYPLVVAFIRRPIVKQAEVLAAKGDAHGATAVTVALSPGKFTAPGSKASHKRALSMEAQSPTKG